MLSGGAAAICGASAALAISAVLPRDKHHDRFTLMVVIAVTVLSTLAMVLYPLIARAMNLNPDLAGLFFGGTIHDVAQVVGAGYTLGPATGDIATIVKLFRVAMLAVVVLLVSMAFKAERERSLTATGQTTSATAAARSHWCPGFCGCSRRWWWSIRPARWPCLGSTAWACCRASVWWWRSRPWA